MHVSTRRLAAAGLAAGVAAALLTTVPAPAGSQPPGTQVAAEVSSGDDVRRELGLSGDQTLIEKDRFTGPNGVEHVRYDRRLGDLRVIGGDLVVHRATARDIESVTWAGPEQIAPESTRPAISEDQAAKKAGASERRAGRSARVAGPGELVVDVTDGAPELAWQVTLGEHPGDRRTALVSAEDGDLVRTWKTNPGADGTGHSLYSGEVPMSTTDTGTGFILKDPARANSRTRLRTNDGKLTMPVDVDNVWGTGEFKSVKTRLADVHSGASATWDFYTDKFGRSGINDDGLGYDSRLELQWGGNAFWDDECQCFMVGARHPFLGSTEVIGHEVSHGVVSATAGLNYWDDSGGLNESTADIMGTLVEWDAGRPADPGDYRIGEQFFAAEKPPYLRRMDRPSLDGVSYDCYTPKVGKDDPHYSSGVGNHFFYLLAQGTGKKTFAGLRHNGVTCGAPTTLTGIGNDAAGQLWYDALRTYMVSTTNYPQARDATVRAAIDSSGTDSATCRAVENAWTGVDVRAWDWSCSGPIDHGPNQVTNGDFENGLTGWRTVSGSPKVGTLPSGGHYLRLPPAAKDGEVVAVRQKVSVPDSRAAALSLRFREANWEYSGNRFQVVVVADGTPKVLLTSRDNWDQPSWTEYRLALRAYAGQRVTLELRMTRTHGDRSAFDIDDIAVTAR